MKNTRRFTLLLCTLLFFACSKPKSETAAAALRGNWKLVETLADPGDGSGTWQPVPATNPQFLAFRANSRLEGNAFPQARTYEVVSDAAIRFVFADGTFIIYNYTLSGSTLVLSGGGCIEACGVKFVKERNNGF